MRTKPCWGASCKRPSLAGTKPGYRLWIPLIFVTSGLVDPCNHAEIFGHQPILLSLVSSRNMPCPRHRRRRRNRQHLAAVVSVPTKPSRRRPRAVVPVSARRRHRAIVPAPSSPRLSWILTPILTSILTPCRRPSSSVLASIRSPRSAILTRSSPSHRCVVVATSSPRRRRAVVAVPSSRRRCRFVGSVVVAVVASSRRRFIVPARCRRIVAAPPPLLVAATPTRLRRPRVVPGRACIVAAVYILTFILTSILTSVRTLSSPRRRLVASSSPSSLRCRRVAVELSCHSAVVAAAFPASSPPRRLVSAPSSFHRAVIGPSRRSSVRLGAPSSSPCRSLVHPGAPSSSSFQSSSPPFGAGIPPSSPKSSSPPLRRRCSPAQHRHRRSRHRPLIR